MMPDIRKKHVNRFAKANYPPRFVSTLFAAGIFISVEHYIAKPIPYFWPFIVLILLWPHIAYLAVRSSKAKKNPEYINIYLDSFICAFSLPLASFNFWVLFASLNVLVSNSFRIGDFRNILIGLFVYLAGFLIGIAIYGFNPVLEFGQITMILSLVCVSCYFVLQSAISKVLMDRLFRSKEYIKNTHAKLEAIHAKLETQNDKIVDSLHYAEMIQRSLLPGIERIKAISSANMFIWLPKDIVGGDIFYTYADSEGSLIALMDCTGHGIPGAFLTMIVYSEIRKIIMEDACREPSEILKRLNRAVKNVLHSHGDANTDDGLDAAVCIIDHSGKKVTYSGAKIPLFYIKNGILHRVNGNKQSIGYKDSDDNYEFTNHTIGVEDCCSFYMKTDGFTDQLGGERRRRFGTDKFKKLIMDHHEKPYSEQRKIFLQALMAHQGENEQVDDITLIGYKL